MIPPRADSLQDRAEAARLRQALSASGTAVVESAGAAPGTPRPDAGVPGDGGPGGGVLAGMGGVGKTQLAADYARTAWRAGELDVLVWISATTRSAVVTGYAQAAADLLAADPADPEAAAAAFLAWLAPSPAHRRRPCRWLVVLDDVADPADLHGLWPPPGPTGRTLITTRRKDAALTGRGRRLIEIGLFTPAEAVAYLADVLAVHGRDEPGAQLAALAADLGYLPLALSQAAAYLVDAALSCAAYRSLLADRRTTLADVAPDALPDDQTHTMAAAWELSVERADTLRPPGLARPMLRLAAFLDPNGIPDTVLTSAPALLHLTEHAGRDPESEQVTADQATLALRALHRLSLVDHTPATPHQAVRVHQLIQRAVRDTLAPDRHDRIALVAADALLAAWPESTHDTALTQAFRANTTVLAARAGQALYRESAHKVLYEVGSSLGGSGHVAGARDHLDLLVRNTTRYLGPDSYFTLGARHNLAEWQGRAGDAAGAAAAYAVLLGDMVRVLGPDHADTFTVRSNLAHFRAEAGDLTGAAAAFAELLDDMVRVLGPDHAETLAVRHNLATRRREAGDLEGAAATFAELLDDMVRVLGPDHHADTLAARHNLAYLQQDAGDATGAAATFAGLVDEAVRVLGPDHPDTLTVRHNHASARGDAGDAAGAAAAFAALLHDTVRVLGPDHPDTFMVRNDLALWQGRTGDAAGAAAAYAALLDDMLRVLAPDHPLVVVARSNLVSWRQQAREENGGPDEGR